MISQTFQESLHTSSVKHRWSSKRAPSVPCYAGAHVTRFIALAPVGNSSKQRFLHALALVPAAEMDAETLAARPANTTSSPYEEASSSRKRPHEAVGSSEAEQVSQAIYGRHTVIC